MPLLASETQAKDIYDAIRVRMALRSREGIAVRYGAYKDRPVEFIQEVLGEHIWSRQKDIAQAVRDHRHVAVQSAHGVGKSWVAARIIAWWLCVHRPGQAFVVSTAPTFQQVRAILWREIRRAHNAARLPGRTNQTEWYLGNELVAFGRKPADYDPAAFQGIHAEAVLAVIDEASGVPPDLWDGVEAIVTSDASRVLAIGNPTDPSSRFAEVCNPTSGWHNLKISGMESPNFTDEHVPDYIRPLLLSPMWVEERKAAWGEGSSLYQSRVLGEFPSDTEDGVIPYSWIQACMRDEEEQGTPIELGVDVGAGGDETVIRERRGKHAGRSWRKRTPDSAQAVNLVLHAIHETGATRVKVDSIGIGWGIVGRLRELRSEGKHSARIAAINVGERSRRADRFPRLRDELWWEIGRELSRTGGWNLSAIDDETVAQLTAPRYEIDSSGRVDVEAKEKTRKRLSRSPDDADALILAFTRPRTQIGTPFTVG